MCLLFKSCTGEKYLIIFLIAGIFLILFFKIIVPGSFQGALTKVG